MNIAFDPRETAAVPENEIMLGMGLPKLRCKALIAAMGAQVVRARTSAALAPS